MDSRRAIKAGQVLARQLELPGSLHANAPYISFTSAHKSCRQHDCKETNSLLAANRQFAIFGTDLSYYSKNSKSQIISF